MNRSNRLYAVMMIAALLALPWTSRACMSVAPVGVPVQIMDEAAVIVWDATTHTEHFVRRATFDTGARNFGFLVPTPGLPQLAEVNKGVFNQLQGLTAPEVRVEVRRHYNFMPLFFEEPPFLVHDTVSANANLVALSGAAAAHSVRVLSQAQVGGYDAVVLEADDTGALASWLKNHGYAARSTLSDWLAPYVAAKWKITAFKIAKQQAQDGSNDNASYDAAPVTLSAVRLSFHTDRPFYPYREPADAREANNYFFGRSLWVTVLSTERVDGTLGAAATAPLWPGMVQWTNRLPAEQRGSLASSLKLSTEQMPANLWMTVMQDSSSPRPGTDEVYFASSPTQVAIVPEPIIHYRDITVPVPLDAIAICSVVASVVVFGVRLVFNWQRRRALRASGSHRGLL
jgi:hypothetical protein